MNAIPRILVVDDEPDVESLVRQHFRRRIRKGEIEFLFAGDGVEALERIAAEPDVAMVLSDINMPRMDGLTLLGRLEEGESDLCAVIVSAYGDMENIRAAMNRGAFDFLTKPLDLDDLERTIDKTLGHVGRMREMEEARLAAEIARSTLEKYFSPAVVAAVVADPSTVGAGSERREASFLFTDMTGFTSMIEQTDSERVVEILNGYIDGISQAIFAHDGAVMKIIGDSVQAMFGAPIAQDDHARQAVTAAQEIDRFCEDFRAQWAKRGLAIGATRIGVNSGEAIVGNFGGERFFDYTAYGATVNIAARLEAANKRLGTRICIGEATVARCPGFAGRPAGALRLAGVAEPVTAWEPVEEDADHGAYTQAYALLGADDAAARDAFSALAANDPDDPLAAMHAARLADGDGGRILFA